MAINFKELDNKINSELKSFKWNDKEINVKPFLTTDEKYDIVMITLQQSYEDGYYNPIKLDMFFHLNLVFIYTDIIFDEEDKEDLGALYDNLKLSGLLNAILKVIDENEYQEMMDCIDDIKCIKEEYVKSIASVANKLIDDLPANAKAALDIVDNFDQEKFAAVQDFAKAANGNRPLVK